MIDIQGTRAMKQGEEFADAGGIRDPSERFDIEMLFSELSREKRGLPADTGGVERNPLHLQMK